MTLDLTPEEAQVLINLIDVAVRARGLECAEASVVLAGKLQTFINTPPEEETVIDLNGRLKSKLEQA